MMNSMPYAQVTPEPDPDPEPEPTPPPTKKKVCIDINGFLFNKYFIAFVKIAFRWGLVFRPMVLSLGCNFESHCSGPLSLKDPWIGGSVPCLCLVYSQGVRQQVKPSTACISMCHHIQYDWNIVNFNINHHWNSICRENLWIVLNTHKII